MAAFLYNNDCDTLYIMMPTLHANPKEKQQKKKSDSFLWKKSLTNKSNFLGQSIA